MALEARSTSSARRRLRVTVALVLAAGLVGATWSDPALAHRPRLHRDRAISFGSYNLLQGMTHPQASKMIGNCRFPGDSLACLSTRSRRQAAVILGALTRRHPMDVVTLSEVSPQQYALLHKVLPGYAFYPWQVSKYHGVAIAWRKRELKLVRGGSVGGVYDNVGKLDQPRFPWVELRTRYGRLVDVLSVHSTARGYPDFTLLQQRNARVFRAWAARRDNGRRLVVVAGDFNTSLADPGRQRPVYRHHRRVGLTPTNAYCLMDHGGVLENNVDLARGAPPGRNCAGNDLTRTALDQVWISTATGMRALRSVNLGVPRQDLRGNPTGTDHGPVMFTVAPFW